MIEPTALARARGDESVGPRPSLGYGWVIVAALTTILTATSGARFLFGVVLKPVSEEFGWDRASLTGAVTVGMVALALCQPLVGLLVDRVGSKRVLVVGTLLLGAVLVPLSFVTRLWQVYLLYGLVATVGFAATSPVNATALVGRWFAEKRGTALAIATSGSAFGQLLVVPLATWALTVTDWRTTYRLLAVVLLAGMVPLGLLALRDAPRSASGHGPRTPPVLDGVDVRTAARTPAFWALSFGFLVCGMTMAFPNTHFVAYVDDMGMAPLHAANAVAVTAVFSVAGSLLLGVAADRVGRRPILAATYALRGVAFVLLLLLPAGDPLFVYSVVLGVSWTATTPLTAAIAADLYGGRHLGAVFGTMFTFMNVGFGLGAVADGLIYELAGGYELALGLNAAFGAAAALAVWLVPAGRRPPLGAPARPKLEASAAAD
ncbi:MAG: MFS transporter [Chloroflexota bacterium]|nr:MFS transporter [Chloroflexota bacterium]